VAGSSNQYDSFLYFSASDAKLKNVVIKESDSNSNVYNGAGIYIFDWTNLTIIDSKFEDLKASNGGVIYAFSVDKLHVENSIF
jgi:glutamine amidotransferase-like uncharacterized protein